MRIAMGYDVLGRRQGGCAGNELASPLRYRAAMAANGMPWAFDQQENRASPSDLYRRISYAAWVAAMCGGALSWTALLHLV